MIESSGEENSSPIYDLEFGHICKETIQQFWIDETATYSCNSLLMGIVVSGMMFLAGWLPA